MSLYIDYSVKEVSHMCEDRLMQTIEVEKSTNNIINSIIKHLWRTSTHYSREVQHINLRVGGGINSYEQARHKSMSTKMLIHQSHWKLPNGKGAMLWYFENVHSDSGIITRRRANFALLSHYGHELLLKCMGII